MRVATLGRRPIGRSAAAVLAAFPALAVFVVGPVAACGRIDFDGVGTTAGNGPDAAPDDALPDDAPPPDACQLGPWTLQLGAQPFGNVNSFGTDWGVEISRDGLRLVFSSDRPNPQQQGTNHDLYMAERSNTDADFDPAVRLPISDDDVNDSDPTLSDDALELYYVASINPRPCIYVSDRMSATASWGPPRRLVPLCQSGQLGGPFLSRDGLRLYYDVVVSGEAVLMMATRASRSVDFAGAGVQVGVPGQLRYCALDDSELTLYCENTGVVRAQLSQATRPTRDAQFDGGREITELANGGMFEDGDPSITGDGLHLVYASSRGPNGTSDVVVAERACQ